MYMLSAPNQCNVSIGSTVFDATLAIHVPVLAMLCVPIRLASYVCEGCLLCCATHAHSSPTFIRRLWPLLSHITHPGFLSRSSQENLRTINPCLHHQGCSSNRAIASLSTMIDGVKSLA